MADAQQIKPNEDAFPAVADWPRLVARAAEALVRALHERGSLTPQRMAVIVARRLPDAARRRLLDGLRGLGWLDENARVPFDVFERPDCPIRVTGGEREIWRLAVFGVSGQGQLSDSKRREAVYQQRCAEILREVRDLESLTYAAARALGHPEVTADPVLAGMLRAFISEREAELRARAPVDSDNNRHSRATTAADFQEFQLPLRERVQRSLARMTLELDRHVERYNEIGAREVLVRIRDLRKRFPGQVESATVEQCEERVGVLGEKRDDFQRHLHDLVGNAVTALDGGDAKTATWVLRRLSAIHSLLPAVLPREKLEEYRGELRQHEQRQERHEAARALVSREQIVGDEIKRLGAAVHRYRELAATKNAAPALLQQAEAEYQAAAARIREYDDEWLADLMIELDGLLEDLHGPRERAEAQVDHFVNNVRQALRHTRDEIRRIQQERSAAS